jgi:hypothetical protein
MVRLLLATAMANYSSHSAALTVERRTSRWPESTA